MAPPLIPPEDTEEQPDGSVFSSFWLADPAGVARLMLIGQLDLVTAPRAREAVRCAQDETPDVDLRSR